MQYLREKCPLLQGINREVKNKFAGFIECRSRTSVSSDYHRQGPVRTASEAGVWAATVRRLGKRLGTLPQRRHRYADSAGIGGRSILDQRPPSHHAAWSALPNRTCGPCPPGRALGHFHGEFMHRPLMVVSSSKRICSQTWSPDLRPSDNCECRAGIFPLLTWSDVVSTKVVLLLFPPCRQPSVD